MTNLQRYSQIRRVLMDCHKATRSPFLTGPDDRDFLKHNQVYNLHNNRIAKALEHLTALMAELTPPHQVGDRDE